MSAPHDSRVYVGGSDLERLTRLETKIDHVLENLDYSRRVFERHDERLKHLENTKAGMYGMAGAIGAVGAFLMDFLKNSLVQR
jgi:hypothetical protein